MYRLWICMRLIQVYSVPFTLNRLFTCIDCVCVCANANAKRIQCWTICWCHKRCNWHIRWYICWCFCWVNTKYCNCTSLLPSFHVLELHKWKLCSLLPPLGSLECQILKLTPLPSIHSQLLLVIISFNPIHVQPDIWPF